ncbi:undecaprenyl-diphosphate phosphatase [Silvimonas amylolytica]|uniref:Undecaprenyl-diphosphatase n=1 Tax=Silvimonas amylolytica TaxID=449663 RepID=A0ABQ2PGB3_9NEIS|nr:undecaprenyl-diphosphate phosphatase [Silvimonas amylolytica]GGP24301.1 undecaprenyl-diphosphatase 1 [Silvimonas amylolytica]
MGLQLESILFAIMQGVSELFPVSSLGHGVVVPDLLHWQMDTRSEQFLPFMVMLHLGTALALLAYFRKDWIELFRDFFRGGCNPNNALARPMWLMIVGTIPAGLLGLLLEKKIKLLFGSTTIVLAVLVINGIMLIVGERAVKRSRGGRKLEDLSFMGALKVGVAQSLALVPGISRSGSTLLGGLSQGLSYEAAARFSFLLATPIILAASVLEVPKAMHETGPLPFAQMALCGLIAGVCAYISTWALMRYFKMHEVKALSPFGWYCIALGVLGLAVKFA